jgi:hypothetical protein
LFDRVRLSSMGDASKLNLCFEIQERKSTRFFELFGL